MCPSLFSPLYEGDHTGLTPRQQEGGSGGPLLTVSEESVRQHHADEASQSNNDSRRGSKNERLRANGRKITQLHGRAQCEHRRGE